MKIEHINITEDQKCIRLSSNNGKHIGGIEFEKIYSIDSNFFEENELNFLEENNLIDLFFTENLCLYISYLVIEEEYMGKGYAKKLMNNFLSYFKKQKFTDIVVLRASPFGTSYNKLDYKLLIGFYEKFGFKVLLPYTNGALMILTK